MKNGDVIKAYGYEWEILDLHYQAKNGEGVLCLMKTPLSQGMGYSKKVINDYRKSDIKEYLKTLTEQLWQKEKNLEI